MSATVIFVASASVFWPGAVRRIRAVSATVTFSLAPASVFTTTVLPLADSWSQYATASARRLRSDGDHSDRQGYSERRHPHQ